MHLLVFFELNNRVVVVVLAIKKFKTDVQLNSFHYKCKEKMSLCVHCNIKWKNKLQI
jgi:hypothetical protein